MSKSMPIKDVRARTHLKLKHRPRRLRRTEGIRNLVRETQLSAASFIYPMFVLDGKKLRREIKTMPGIFQCSIDEAVREAATAYGEGVSGVLLFGLPAVKDSVGSPAFDTKGPVQEAIRAIKKTVPDLIVITDVCLCEYTEHGHCGILEGENIVNDATVEQLVKTALSHAEAGADIVAPSDMMDGRIGAIRQALDEQNFDQVSIMSYAAKYCSAFYGPFREAANSTPQFGDRRSHQMDPANVNEALHEVEQDLAEGADIVMVKPAVPYLDVIAKVKSRFMRPTAAYHVSGEYSMIKAAAAHGWIDERRVMVETLTSIARAGADIIITYYARDAVRLLNADL